MVPRESTESGILFVSRLERLPSLPGYGIGLFGLCRNEMRLLTCENGWYREADSPRLDLIQPGLLYYIGDE